MGNTVGHMADFGYNGKLNKLRKAIESDDFTLVQEEMMKEGEIGKLADAILHREREYQTALEKERKQKEYLRDLISDISHQLKTPIASPYPGSGKRTRNRYGKCSGIGRKTS